MLRELVCMLLLLSLVPSVSFGLTDHEKAVALVPDEQATVRAVQSGLWSVPATWGGKVPIGGDKVFIPRGITVTQDVDTRRILWLRVDGTLQPAQGATVTLTVGTWVTTMGSTIQAGDETQPFAGQWNIVFRDYGPAADAWRLEHGFIPCGAVSLHGKPKTTWQFIEGASAGDRSIRLKNPVTGWAAGDQLVIPGTRFNVNDDDECAVASISGQTIKLTAELKFDHLATDRFGFPRPMFVANISPRSIDFGSENPAITNRGHIMCMADKMTPQDFFHCSFRDLGRTDKSIKVSDPDGLGGGTENPRGRYALHFHKNGPDLDGMERRVFGCVALGTPGWLYVNHLSRVCFQHNVGYKFGGACFTGEEGHETGCIRSNVAIRPTARPKGFFSDDRGTADKPLSDWGHNGEAIFLLGGGIETSGNISTGNPDFAFVTGGDGFKDPKTRAITMFDTANIPGYSGTATQILPKEVPQIHSGFQCFGAKFGFVSWTLNGNPGPAVPKVGKSRFSDFKIESEKFGLGQTYQSHVDFVRCKFVCTKKGSQETAITHTGVNGNIGFDGCETYGFLTGLQAANHSANFIKNCKFQAATGILVTSKFGAGTDFMTIDISGCEFPPMPAADFAALPATGNQPFYRYQGKQQKGVVALSGWVAGGPLLRVTDARQITGYTQSYPPIFGPAVRITLDGKRLWFSEEHPNFRWSDVANAPAYLKPLTNRQAWEQYGLAIGAKLLPDDAVIPPGHLCVVSEKDAEFLPPVLTNKRWPAIDRWSYQQTNQTAGYVAKVKDGAGNWLNSAPTDLTDREWNVVTIDFKGHKRGIFVYCDSAGTASQPW
ncbi:MAG: G8 domain-containing protein [Planctomycetaceae bacterium]